MKLPNLFIVGAAKCGTSALHAYLAEHPQIVMSRDKEPNYFAPEIATRRSVESLDEYLKLFAAATPATRFAGESTVEYLPSPTAIDAIHRFNRRARLIAMVRSPIELVHSLHAQRTWEMEEDRPFEEAIALEEARRRGSCVPPLCRSSKLLQYTRYALLGEQVERLMRTVPSSQVKVIVLDDLRHSPRRVYDEVLRFLDVDEHQLERFAVVNQRKEVRSRWLGRLVKRPPRPVLTAATAVKWVTGRERLGIAARLHHANSRPAARRPMSSTVHARLVDRFENDVNKLSDLLGRDLRYWLS